MCSSVDGELTYQQRSDTESSIMIAWWAVLGGEDEGAEEESVLVEGSGIDKCHATLSSFASASTTFSFCSNTMCMHSGQRMRTSRISRRAIVFISPSHQAVSRIDQQRPSHTVGANSNLKPCHAQRTHTFQHTLSTSLVEALALL